MCRQTWHGTCARSSLMEYLTLHETPSVELPYLVTAFRGWPDAGEGASGALRYLMRRLRAKKLADLESEEFYDFTQTRPYTTRTRAGHRRVHWPANEFSYWSGPGRNKGAMTFLGIEPNLRWQTYSRTIAELAQQYGVKNIIHVGALLDAVPHTREVKLSGTSNNSESQQKLEAAAIHSSNYQGPTGISSAVMEACAKEGMDYLSLWGHTAHYLQAAPNYRIGYTLAQRLSTFLDLPLDLEELKTAAETFDEEVVKAVAKDDQLSAYVQKLEGEYDESALVAEIPDPEELVQDLERFLRSEQRRRPGDPQT